MNSVNRALQQRLRPAQRRLRRFHFWRMWCFIATCLVIAGWAFMSSRGMEGFGNLRLSNFGEGKDSAKWVAAIGGIGWLVCLVVSRFLTRDVHQLARKIEMRFPTLQQRLMTAIEQDPEETSFLGQRVIKEARDHSRFNRWTDIVSAVKMFWARVAGLTSTLALVFVMLAIATARPARSVAVAAIQTDQKSTVEVRPGNAEIEKGSSVVISARFTGDLALDAPSDGVLQIETLDATQKSVAMHRNLSDPILATLVESVEADFDYTIDTSSWRSDTFRISVFEYPSLQRSDAEIEYPDYLQRSPKVVEDTVRVSAIRESDVTWTLNLNKPVTEAKLVDEANDETIELDVSPGVQLQTQIHVQGDRNFILRLVDEKGRKNQFPAKLSIRAIDNSKPQFELTRGGDANVSALEEFDVEAKMTDDVGFIAAGIRYAIQGQPATDVTLLESDDAEPGKREVRLSHIIDFEALKAQPDQSLTYSYWADTHDSNGERIRTNSDLFFADVRPFEQVFRKGEPPPSSQKPSQNEQKASKLAELQKEIISATWKLIGRSAKEKSLPSFAEDVKVVADSQQEAAGMLTDLMQKLNDEESKRIAEAVLLEMKAAVEELAEEQLAATKNQSLDDALAAEQAAYDGLLKLRSREFQVTKSNRSSSGGQSAARARNRQLNELEIEQDENRYEQEKRAQSSEEESAKRENRQILNRLKELARRQKDINQEIAKLQAALREAKTEKEKDDVKRQLERLREQQQEMLRDVDELTERMEDAPSREESQKQSREEEQQSQQQDSKEQNSSQEQSSQQAKSGQQNSSERQSQQQQLDQARQSMRKAGESIEQQDAASALSAGSRAQEQLESLRDEFRKQQSGQFDDSMKDLRDRAEDLAKRQAELGAAINQEESEEQTGGLRDSKEKADVGKQLREQKQRLEELLESVRETVEKAESTEPLLAEALFDAYKTAEREKIGERLDQTRQLQALGFEPQAKQADTIARRGIERLRDDLNKAAESVLGSSEEALRRASEAMEQLEEQVSPNKPSQSNGSKQQTEQQQSAPKDSPPSEGQSKGGKQASQNSKPSSESQADSPGQPSPQGTATIDRFAAGSPSEQSAASSTNSSPITGEGFREFSDKLRDVEEMVDAKDLSSRAAQIRDRAREMRIDYRRNSKAPSQDLYEELIVTPVRELRRDLQEELLRRQGDAESLVPIDRDPVPRAFQTATETYFQRIASQNANGDQPTQKPKSESAK